MIQMETIRNLKKKAEKDMALEATLDVCKARKRARNQITVRGLKQRMESQGWKEFDENDYRRVLKTLAEHGIGKLEKDSSGRVTALTEITITLQSLGAAVIDGLYRGIEKFQPRNKYVPVVKPEAKAPLEEAHKVELSPPHPLRRVTDRLPHASETLTIPVNGKPVIVQIPDNFTAEEIAEFLTKIRSWRAPVRDGNSKDKK